MIGLLLPFLGFVPERLRKAAAWAVLVVVALGALLAGKALYDASVVRKHDNKQEVKTLRRTIKQERKADAADHEQQSQDSAAKEQLEEEVRNAVQAHPEEVRRSSGPAANAALAELRRRREAERRDTAR